MGKSPAKSSISIVKDDTYLQSIIPKRLQMFEWLKDEQNLRRMSISGEPIKVTLLDGTLKEGKKWETTPFDIAKGLSKTLAANALISQVDGVLWDMSRPLESDCKLKLLTFDSDLGRDTFWHSSAHILGQAMEQTFGCKLCIGSCTNRGQGFFYDAFYGDLALNGHHFDAILSGAKKVVAERQPFERIEVSRQQALEMFSDNKFKVEIISDLPEDKTITVYRCGPLVDLCRGPHIPNTAFIKAIACLKASAAYWRGNKDRESLQRVYGISYPDQEHLKEARAIKVTKETQRLMSKLRKQLQKVEADIENRRANAVCKKAIADSCRKDFRFYVSPCGGGAPTIFHALQNIKGLLNKVTASKSVEMQQSFSRLCAEAQAVENKIFNDMKNQVEEYMEWVL